MYINILPILLDTVMDFSHHDLHVQFELTGICCIEPCLAGFLNFMFNSIIFSDAECAVNVSAEFLGLHSADPRIILASCKDSLLQALGTLTCHKTGVRSLERSPKKRCMRVCK